ncbi:MAG: integrase zinc binding domain-containing protein, partial [Pseudomonadota bacterium]
MEQTLQRHFHHPKMQETIRQVVQQCDVCQKIKRGSRQYGSLAPRDATAMPWQEIHCDTVGPWKLELRACTIEFKAVTTIDPATNLVEINPIITKTAQEVAQAVETNWLSRYPRPLRCISNKGSEFAEEFQAMLR